jgi:flagellar basal-body rod protein FlgB
MLLDGLLERGSIAVLGKVMAFTEARHQVLVNNVSNFDTVGYRMRDLPVAQFHATLDQAIQARTKAGANAPLDMPSQRGLAWDAQGRLHALAQQIEPENQNVLFHDGNNRFVEKQMSELSQNALRHNVVAALLKGKYDELGAAIRGRL